MSATSRKKTSNVIIIVLDSNNSQNYDIVIMMTYHFPLIEEWNEFLDDDDQVIEDIDVPE